MHNRVYQTPNSMQALMAIARHEAGNLPGRGRGQGDGGFAGNAEHGWTPLAVT